MRRELISSLGAAESHSAPQPVSAPTVTVDSVYCPTFRAAHHGSSCATRSSSATRPSSETVCRPSPPFVSCTRRSFAPVVLPSIHLLVCNTRWPSAPVGAPVACLFLPAVRARHLREVSTLQGTPAPRNLAVSTLQGTPASHRRCGVALKRHAPLTSIVPRPSAATARRPTPAPRNPAVSTLPGTPASHLCGVALRSHASLTSMVPRPSAATAVVAATVT